MWVGSRGDRQVHVINRQVHINCLSVDINRWLCTERADRQVCTERADKTGLTETDRYALADKHRLDSIKIIFALFKNSK